MKRVAALLVLLVLVGFAGSARADDFFAQANKDFADRSYEAAIAKYEQLAQGGLRHQDLYYNLGNAYFRSAQMGNQGRIGRAILAYERALVMDPTHEDARYNLDVARELVGNRYGADKVKDAAKDSFWIRAVTWLPQAMLSRAFLVLDVLFFLLLVAIRFLPSGFLRTGLVVGNVFSGLAGAFLGVLLAGQVYYLETVQTSVVVADEVVMREGPDPARREGPKLHAGHRAVVLDESHGWLKVRLANQMEGWVPRDTVEVI